MPITLDGTNTTSWGRTTPTTISITTAGSTNLIALVISMNIFEGNGTQVNSVTSPNLTFHQRAALTRDNRSRVEVWMAIATKALTAESITITQDVGTESAAVVFSFTGVNFSSVAGSGLPRTNSGVNSIPSISGLNTNNAANVILFMYGGNNTGLASNPSPPTGFTTIAGIIGPDTTLGIGYYESVSSLQSGVSISASASLIDRWIAVGDAVEEMVAQEVVADSQFRVSQAAAIVPISTNNNPLGGAPGSGSGNINWGGVSPPSIPPTTGRVPWGGPGQVPGGLPQPSFPGQPRVSQAAAIFFASLTDPAASRIPVFPILPIGFPVKWRPTARTTIGKASSGREVRFYNQQLTMLHEFEILFEELRDRTQNQVPYSPLSGYQDYMTLCQLWLMMYGRFGLFYFDVSWDDSRLDQIIGIGDGVTRKFTFSRTYGSGSLASITEPVGGVNNVTNIKIGGVLQLSASYSISGNSVTFLTAPANGAAITSTFSFFYLCHFMEDNQKFEEFSKNRWIVPNLKFRSVDWPLRP